MEAPYSRATRNFKESVNVKLRPYPVFLLFFTAAPFASIPYIYFGFKYVPIILDVFLVCLVALLVCNGALKSRSSALFLYWAYCVVNIFYLFYTEIPTIYASLIGFRLSFLGSLTFLIPFYLSWNRARVDKLHVVLAYIAILVSINAVRQWAFPLGSEISFANSAGGAAKFYGDDVQGGRNTFRVFSVFITSVHLATFLTLTIYISFVQYFLLQARRLYLISFLLSGVAMILTFSRSAWLACLVGFTPLLVFLFKYKLNVLFNVRNIIVVCVGFAAFGGVVSSNELVKARWSTLFDVHEVSSFQSRIEMWGDRVEDIRARPMGYGVGAAGWNLNDVMGMGADSNYLKFWIELGLVGGSIGLFLLFFLFAIYWKTFFAYLTQKNLEFNGAAFVCSFGLVLAVFVQMITNQITEGYPANLYIWFFAALGLRIREVDVESNRLKNSRNIECRRGELA